MTRLPDLAAIRAYRWQIGMGLAAAAALSAFVLVRELGYLSPAAAARPSEDERSTLQRLQDQNNQLQAKVQELEQSASAPRTATESSSAGLVDINAATAAELEQLPGIGPSKAAAIVAYRTANGPFRDAKSITNVKGIGESTYDQLKDSITVKAR